MYKKAQIPQMKAAREEEIQTLKNRMEKMGGKDRSINILKERQISNETKKYMGTFGKREIDQ